MAGWLGGWVAGKEVKIRLPQFNCNCNCQLELSLVIDNVKFKPLDSKAQGAGLEIDVEVTHNKSRGVAILKIYGPKEDIKKANTVTVSKSRESDSKYIVILAERVIKPLMDQFLSGEREIEETKDVSKPVDLVPSQIKQFKCSFCEKICKTSAGLKGHTTKMHLDSQQEEEDEPLKNKRKSRDEVTEVVESLLKEVIDISEEEVTLEDTVCGAIEEKKYTKMCEACDFKLEANKKYMLLQKLRHHKVSCLSRIQCSNCDIKVKDQQQVKRHMCDEHNLMSGSTSPPLKKKKVDEKLSAPADAEYFDKPEVMDLSESLEDMDICEEDGEKDADENYIFVERSKKMDEKVRAKAKKNDEEVARFMLNKNKKTGSKEEKGK